MNPIGIGTATGKLRQIIESVQKKRVAVRVRNMNRVAPRAPCVAVTGSPMNDSMMSCRQHRNRDGDPNCGFCRDHDSEDKKRRELVMAARVILGTYVHPCHADEVPEDECCMCRLRYAADDCS